MISLSTQTYDINGVLRLPARPTNPFQGERRATVTATLDGGAAVYDGGYSVSDQIITASLRHPTRAQLVSLQYLVAFYGQVVACTEAGAFLALLSFSANKGACSISLRLLERLDA